jgi:hypothetical protein
MLPCPPLMSACYLLGTGSGGRGLGGWRTADCTVSAVWGASCTLCSAALLGITAGIISAGITSAGIISAGITSAGIISAGACCHSTCHINTCHTVMQAVIIEH